MSEESERKFPHGECGCRRECGSGCSCAGAHLDQQAAVRAVQAILAAAVGQGEERPAQSNARNLN